MIYLLSWTTLKISPGDPIFLLIAEEKGETASGLEIKIQQVLSENLGLDGTKIEIERAHRMGQFQEER